MVLFNIIDYLKISIYKIDFMWAVLISIIPCFFLPNFDDFPCRFLSEPVLHFTIWFVYHLLLAAMWLQLYTFVMYYTFVCKYSYINIIMVIVNIIYMYTHEGAYGLEYFMFLLKHRCRIIATLLQSCFLYIHGWLHYLNAH